MTMSPGSVIGVGYPKGHRCKRLRCALVRVLVVGSGAREHALLLALRRDPEVEALAVAPGNAGTAIIADQYDVDITSGDAVTKLARRIGADLVIVGPEVPLVLGVADAVRSAGIACFGPTKDAARIEGSKSFAKDVMSAAGVRTASSEIVDNPAHLDAALDRFGPPGGDPSWVVKDDGLAAGKGVVVTADRDGRLAHTRPACWTSGHPVLPRVVPGRSRGVAVLCRRRRDGGAAAGRLRTSSASATTTPDPTPAAWAPMRRCRGLPDDVVAAIVDDIVKPGCRRDLLHRGSAFLGAAVCGAGDHLAGTGGGRIQLPLRRSGDTGRTRAARHAPSANLLHAAATGRLAEHPPLQWRDGAAVAVVLAAENYPGRPRVGDVIVGSRGPRAVLHAGTARRDDGAIVSSGGRVLSVVGNRCRPWPRRAMQLIR